MNVQFAHPWFLLLLPPALAWVVWLAVRTDVAVAASRRWVALLLRIVVVLALVLAIAGLQWLYPVEGMNVFFVLDRSDSIPSAQQEAAREFVNRTARKKRNVDKAGVIVFGSAAAIESSPNSALNLQKVQAIVGTERTDLAAAVRLGTAAFPETGQKRLVLLTDGNENVGDAMAAVLAAKPLGVTADVVPMGVTRAFDVSVQKLQLPSRLKKGQLFEAKIFIQTDKTTPANVRLYRNEQFLGEQRVQLLAGKNLFTFPQTLPEQGYYSYDVQVDVPGDPIPQNNRASGFVSVRGEPRILVLSSDPEQDRSLLNALRSSRLEATLATIDKLPGTLSELQSFDAVFISNLAAGDIGSERQKFLESAVRDFGIGLVCVGGDKAYAAGAYRGTPLETTLPVSMELDSKKVLPSGAVVLVMHGMEFAGGNQTARDCAQGVLQALGPTDEIGVLLWDGNERWIIPLQKVGNSANRSILAQEIADMNQGDLVSFQGVLQQAHSALKSSHASLKHIIVFSDGDPSLPTQNLMESIVADRITVSSILISGHVGPDTMIWIADHGKGRFYDIKSPSDLPQIFIKETAVILKSAIFEEPFKPQLRSPSEVVRGIDAAEYPILQGYVASSPKLRAETPLWTDKGDPLLAHWQYGLGRAVAFTSDAKARWARTWLEWSKYRQFWAQIGQWSLRRLENADFNTEVSVEKGEGVLTIDAADEQGNYRNFLNLQIVAVSPKGQRTTVRAQQTGPGHYEAQFPTREVGSYLLNVLEMKEGQVLGSQVVGASVNYSPEFNATEPNMNLLRRLADSGGGRVLEPAVSSDNPFLHDRQKTFQPRDLWEWLLQMAVLLFVADVGVRRVQLDEAEVKRWLESVRRKLFPSYQPKSAAAEESLGALLQKRNAVRAQQQARSAPEPPPALFQPRQQPVEGAAEEAMPPSPPASAAPPPASPSSEAPQPTTSRLLEAKRRAQHRRR